MHSTKQVVVVGHGMVGHRFVEALRARDTDGTWQITVLAEEAEAAYDRVGLTGYTEHWERARLALPGNRYADDEHVELVLRRPRRPRSTGPPKTCDTAGRRGSPTTPWSWPPARLRSSRRCRATTCPVATSTARSTTSTPSAPTCGRRLAAGDTGRGRHRRRPARSGSGECVAQLRDDAARRRARAAADGSAARPGRRCAAGRMISDLGIDVHVDVGTDAIERADDGTVRVLLSRRHADRRGRGDLRRGCPPARRTGRDGRPGARRAWWRADRPVLCHWGSQHLRGRRGGRHRRPLLRVGGPGYTSAEVVADRLLGGAAEFGEADMSTKLKLLGVDVASFGDAMGATPDCLEVVVNDAVNQTYAKLVLSDDAKTLLGGILVGDASAYGVLRPMVGERLPGDPLVADRAGPEQVPVQQHSVSVRCRMPRRSARATTSPRASSRTPSPAAAPTCPP